MIGITGASGFVGKALVKECLRRGLPYRAISRDSINLEGIDKLIHLAGLAHVNGGDYQASNVDLTRNLADLSVKNGVKQFIFASTIKVLGEFGEFDNHSPVYPQDDYAKSKVLAEELLRDYPFDLAILRPPLIYGQGAKANMGSLFKAVKAGWPLPFRGVQNRRSLLYLGNFVDVLLRDLPKGTYLVCDEKPVSLGQLITMISEAAEVQDRSFTLPSPLFKLLPQGIYMRLFADLYFKSDFQVPYTTAQGLHLSLCPILGTLPQELKGDAIG